MSPNTTPSAPTTRALFATLCPPRRVERAESVDDIEQLTVPVNNGRHAKLHDQSRGIEESHVSC
jgi:hypothetical protein